jgi:hypothetical protein
MIVTVLPLALLAVGLLNSGYVYFWMQDGVFTSQFRLHDFQPSWQSISFGDGFKAQTLSSFLSS